MSSHHLAAQAYASVDPTIGQALHALSRLRGRADALEIAIAEGNLRGRLKALVELSELVEELVYITTRREAA